MKRSNKEYKQKWFLNPKNKLRDKKAKKKYQQTHLYLFSRYSKKWFKKLKLEVLMHYSNNSPKCEVCGFDDIRILVLDHVNNDGAKHRKEIGTTGTRALYYDIKKKNFPKGFQVLCPNHNALKECERREKEYIKRQKEHEEKIKLCTV